MKKQVEALEVGDSVELLVTGNQVLSGVVDHFEHGDVFVDPRDGLSDYYVISPLSYGVPVYRQWWEDDEPMDQAVGDLTGIEVHR